MKLLDLKDLIIPKAGIGHFVETWLTWSGVGFTATLLADYLDRLAILSYAFYYTQAINDAVGYQFWVLLSEIALFAFCLALPLISISRLVSRMDTWVRRIRRITYLYFLVAFDEGALMIGILLANYLYTGERIEMLAEKSFLFSEVGLFSILMLILFNSLLWLLGESIYNRDDASISGVVFQLMRAPVRYTIPGYIILTAIILVAALSQ